MARSALDLAAAFCARFRDLSESFLALIILALEAMTFLYWASASMARSALDLAAAFCARFLWSLTGVISLWIFGALDLALCLSLASRLRLITYLVTSSSLSRLKRALILLALLGPNLLGMVLSVSPGISASPFLTMTVDTTDICESTMHPLTDFRFLSPFLPAL